MELPDLRALIDLLREKGVQTYQTADVQIVFGAVPGGASEASGEAHNDVIPGVSDGDGVAEDEEPGVSLLEKLRAANFKAGKR